MRLKVLAPLVCAALFAVLLVPGTAHAGRKVTIKGGGWGHGIGMSQYGAYGRALKGKTGTEIVKTYYTGTKVRERSMPSKIRVGLLQTRTSVGFSSSAFKQDGGKLVFKVKGSKNQIAQGGTSADWRVDLSLTGGVKLFKNGKQIEKEDNKVFGDPDHPLVVRYEEYGSLVRVTQKSINYAYGRIEVWPFATSSCAGKFCLETVIVLPMQQYLYGLGEVPASWPKGALEAQAIAGRTYAFKRVEDSGQFRVPCLCAVVDSTLDQVYIGDAKRTGSGQYWKDWKKAVDNTKDVVITYNGDPISALYSSSSGGYTENNENVWGGSPYPYLRGVKDGPDAVAANPNHSWKVTMSWSEFSAKLDAAFNTGNLIRFVIKEPLGVSKRVTVVFSKKRGGVKIVGEAATRRESGWDVRNALGLKDTLFGITVTKVASPSS